MAEEKKMYGPGDVKYETRNIRKCEIDAGLFRWDVRTLKVGDRLTVTNKEGEVVTIIEVTE